MPHGADPPRDADLEAKIAYLEREMDHVREQIAELWQDLTGLAKRVEKLERRAADAGADSGETS